MDLTGTRRTPLGGTYRELAARAGTEPGVPEGVYSDHSGVSPDDEIVVDREAVHLLLGRFATGEEALRGFAAGSGREIEPEHFDLAVHERALREFFAAGATAARG